MNAKKCKAIRRSVLATLSSERIETRYQPIKRRAKDLGIGGQRITVCDPIRLLPGCARFEIKRLKKIRLTRLHLSAFTRAQTSADDQPTTTGTTQ